MIILGVVVVTVLASGGVWVGVRGLPVREHLTQAAQTMRALQTQMRAGQTADARASLDALQRQTRAARHAADGLDWRALSHLPAVGANVSAVRTVTTVLDQLSHDALPAMVDLTSTLRLDAVTPKNGTVDLTPLRTAAPTVATAHAAAARALSTVKPLTTADLWPQVRDAVTTLHDGLHTMTALLATAQRATDLVPSLLGARGRRTHLVLFQNPAELRATGGMPGAFLVVEADGGRVRLVDVGTASADLRAFDTPVLPIEPEMHSLYTDRMGVFPADINFTPHFPTTAALAQEMYRRRTGVRVDGVIATDPVALSYLLRATGPVRPQGGPVLSAANAVSQLLSRAYIDLPTGPAQDRYFASAARAVFDTLSRGSANPTAALAALARAASERRILVWSSHAGEQQHIAGTVLAGEMPLDDGDRPTVGVFLNDGSGAKLGYYLSGNAAVRGGQCRSGGRRELALRVTVHSAAPTSGLPRAVLGLGLGGDPYTARTNIMIFAPAGGGVVDARIDGQPAQIGMGRERGRFVAVATIFTKPGATSTVDVTVLTAAPKTSAVSQLRPRLWATPGVNPWALHAEKTTTCAIAG